MAAAADHSEIAPVANPWVVAAAVMLATFMEVLDTSVANVSLPHIAGNLSASVDEGTWVLTSYLMSNAIVLPLSGWFATLFGRKRFYLGCAVIFTLSSLLCGLAPSLPWLVVFRVIQGAGGGGLQPISQAILMDSFPVQKRGIAMGVYGMGVVFAPTVGPTLGGWITDDFSWRWIFLINVPVGIISVLMTSILISDPPHLVRRTFKQGLKIDFVGLGFVSVGLGFLQLVLDKGERDDWFSSPFIIWSSVIAVVGLIAAVFWEWHVKDPVVDLKLLRDRNFVISVFMMYILGIVIYGTQVLVPILLQTLMGYSAMKSGLALLPGGLVLIGMLPFVGRLLDRIEPRGIIVTGLCLAALALVRLSHYSLQASMGTMEWDWVVSRMGTACLFVPINVMAFYFVPRDKTSAATGLINLARNVGGSTGISFMATLMTRRAQFHQGVLVGKLQNGSVDYRAALAHLSHFLLTRGADAARAAKEAQALVYGEMQRQAMMLSFVDCFHAVEILCLVVIPLIFVMRMPERRESRVAPAGRTEGAAAPSGSSQPAAQFSAREKTGAPKPATGLARLES